MAHQRPIRKKPTQDDGRLPPHSIEAEQGVLGSILIDKSALDDALLVIESEDFFYDMRHQAIWVAILQLYEEQRPITAASVFQILQDQHQAEQCGGAAYILGLPEKSPTGLAASYFTDILREKHTLRNLIKFGTNLVCEAYEHPHDVSELLNTASSTFWSITERKQVNGFKLTKALVGEAMDAMDRFISNQGAIGGISTGFHDLDSLTGGLYPGEMTVVGGRPSSGKTSLALNIAEHVCVDLDLPVGIFSMEMTGQQLMMRLITSKARLNLRQIRTGFLGEADQTKLVESAGRLRKIKLYVDETGTLSLAEFKAKARVMVHRHEVKLLFIDYIQLMTLGRRAENRNQELAAISAGIKSAAKVLQVPIVVLSQLNRDLDRASRRPKLSDLRDSGGIEADADMVAFLHPEGGESDSHCTNLIIAKQRNGPCGDVDLIFLKDFTRFENAAKIDASDAEETQPLPYKD